MSIGERIVSLRTDLGLSQGDLASLLDVSRQAVSKWENDLSSPDTIKLIRLADVLNTDVEFLATGKHTNHTVEQVIVKVPEIQERIVEVPVIKKVSRLQWYRNPVEFFLVGMICFLIGLFVGILL